MDAEGRGRPRVAADLEEELPNSAVEVDVRAGHGEAAAAPEYLRTNQDVSGVRRGAGVTDRKSVV